MDSGIGRDDEHDAGQLQAADQEQRRFVSDASHELRSPLATLQRRAESPPLTPPGRHGREMKTILTGETPRMQYLVEDLLTLAGSDRGLRLELANVDLDDV